MQKLFDTLILIVAAVGISAGVWVGANLLFDQVHKNWVRFSALISFVGGFVVLLLVQGNRLLQSNGPSSDSITNFGELIWTPVLGGLIVAALAVLVARTEEALTRLIVGVGSGLIVGVAIGLRLVEEARPEIEAGWLIGWTVVVGAIGAGLGVLRGRGWTTGLLWGAAIGWLLGAFAMPDLGSGSVTEAVLGAAVPGLLLGLRVGRGKNTDRLGRGRLDTRSRATIFVAPALAFVAIALVAPTMLTLWLSLKDRDSEFFVGIDNYRSVFTDVNSFDIGAWSAIFTSRLFIVGIILLVLALVVGFARRLQSGSGFEAGGPAFAPLILSSVLIAFAVFSVLRGTILNNVWWVFTVTVFSTGLGLAIAVLADRAKFESAAKSIIFMPMAISLVGASVIWRFMYLARDTSKPQTGLLNALWVGLGRLSTGSGIPTTVGTVVLWLALLGTLAATARSLVRRRWDHVALPAIATVFLGWIAFRYIGWLGEGIGGFREGADGAIKPDTVFFVQDTPFNNVWLMVILIWIQTGFAMVILSAAIKAVPTELLEAARVDGATESQVFWRVTIPQITTTIGVVVTTLIVLVMKVYDIVKVVTNGNFGTQVLANDMFQQAFTNQNRGVGAALAAILFFSVLPVMVLNIRRMQRDS